MPKYARKYADEDIASAVAQSLSIREVMKRLGMTESGGARQHLNRRIASLELDTTHFLGQSARRGIPAHNRRSLDEILVLRDPTRGREDSAVLRKAMMHAGVAYVCGVTGCPTLSLDFWSGVVLEIDHKNGDAFDNRRENLWFLCPNCHAAQPTSSHSWKNAERYSVRTMCGCGRRKQPASKQCSECYQESRKTA